MKALLAAIVLAMLAMPGRVPAVEFSTVEFAGKRFTVCRVEVDKERPGLFHRDEAGQPFKRFDRLSAWLHTRGRKLVFAMNAGMFHPDYSAVGLFVADGRQINALNTASGEDNFFLKPNGVFALTETCARVIEASEYPRLPVRTLLATQSGPLLVRAGRLHPAFNAGSTSRLLRNGVGVPAPGVAIFVLSEDPVNFHEFATLFRDKLACPDALFLDGDISSIYAPAIKRNDFRRDLGPIIAVTE